MGKGVINLLSGKDSLQVTGEKISFNSRAVLLGLFTLVGFILLVFTVSVNAFPPEQSGRLNTVFIAAISGSLALGGTLISQLWGTKTTTTPIIFATNPDDTANGVPVDTPISASFNMTMDKSSINSKTFTLKDGVDSSLVSGAITLEGGNAIHRPAGPLKPLTKYIAKITKDVKSTDGTSIQSDKEWSFTTEEDAKSVSLNTPPKADPQSVTTKVNDPIPIVLKAVDPDKDKLTFAKVTDPSNGKLSEFDSSIGKVTYTPNKDYVGSDSFTFKVNDGKADSNIATVSIIISKSA